MTELLTNVVFSATALKDFMSCPRKFQLRKEQVKETSVGSQLLLGSAVHSTIEAFYNKEYIADIQAAPYFESEYKKQYGMYKGRGMDISYSRYNNYKKDIREGSAMCQGFVRHIAPTINVIACEASLQAHLPTDVGLFPLECHIDLVIEEPAGYIVSDLKTGRSAPHEMYMLEDIQLEMYAYALDNGVFIDVDRSSKQKVYTEADGFKRTKPTIGKSIINLRGLISSTAEILDPPVMGDIIFRSDTMSQTHFLNTCNAYVRTMNDFETTGYWPKHIGSIHDSHCPYCQYYQTCIKQD
jgi:CRISPR/Cas system-associated exonuclease Cas4 (RecB family)